MPQPYNSHQAMNDLKRAAAERAKQLGLAYAGALLPSEAHRLMQAGAKLVDGMGADRRDDAGHHRC